MSAAPGNAGPITMNVWSPDGKTWPTCYYIPEQLCGEKTICDCPSCPIRCGAKMQVFNQKLEDQKRT